MVGHKTIVLKPLNCQWFFYLAALSRSKLIFLKWISVVFYLNMAYLNFRLHILLILVKD